MARTILVVLGLVSTTGVIVPGTRFQPRAMPAAALRRLPRAMPAAAARLAWRQPAAAAASARSTARANVPVLATAASSESASWLPIQKTLDAAPVFTLANKDGMPLQYEVGGQPKAVFYADVLAAKKEFEAASVQHPDLECDLIPVGLGAAYKLTREGKASLVPGVAELTAAGMPEGVSAVGQELPLFACMNMTREKEDGGTVLPLFMSFEDCDAAVTEAREAEGVDSDLEVVALSLPSVVEHLSSTADGTTPFDFVAPTSSTDHLSRYVGNINGKSVYARVVDTEAE